MTNLCLVSLVACFLISLNSYAETVASKGSFKDAVDSDFPDYVRKEDRVPSYKVDLNGDGKEDVVSIQVNEATKQSRAILVFTQKDGTKKEEVLKDHPLLKGKVDLTLSIKKAGEAGISERKYFDEEGNTQKRAAYKKAPAVEVSYDQDYCTHGFIFIDQVVTKYEVCD